MTRPCPPKNRIQNLVAFSGLIQGKSIISSHNRCYICWTNLANSSLSLFFCVVYNASFRSCQVLDDEGEEDDDNEKDANQGSFVFSHFIWNKFVLTVSYQGGSNWLISEFLRPEHGLSWRRQAEAVSISPCLRLLVESFDGLIRIRLFFPVS